MTVSTKGGHSPPRCLLNEAVVQKKRFVLLFEIERVLTNGSSQRVETNGSPPERIGQALEYSLVQAVQATSIDPHLVERILSHALTDLWSTFNLGKVSHTAQKPVRDPRRPPASTGDLQSPLVGELEFELSGGAFENVGQL